MYAFALRFVRPYWKWLAVVAVAILIQTAMSLASPWPLKIVLDSVLNQKPMPDWLGRLVAPDAGQSAVLLAAVIATVAIAIFEAIGGYLNTFYTSNIGQWVAHDLRQTVYAHLLRLSMSYHDRQQVAPLVSTITEDIDTVQDFISNSALKIVVDVLTVVGMLVVMLTLNLYFTLLALLVAPLVGLFVYRLRFIVKQAMHDVRRRQGEMATIVQEGLGAIKLVKAFAQGAFERQRFDEKSVQSVKAALYARRARSLVGPIVTIFVACGTAAVLWFGARLVLNGTMTAGVLVVFMTYLGRLFGPIQDLARVSTNVAQTAVGLERVMAILQTDERLPRASQPRSLADVRGAVEFRDVTFGYDPARPVLHGISFHVEPGQRVALVGRSGSGKSTLVSLIPRFYDPTSGAVAIDGIDVRDVSFRSLRRQIGFVLQDTVLFHATIRQNIGYGRADATRDEIEAAARLAHAEEFIDALPDGYDTVVGPGGFTLSGGQRQRLGIARAIVRDAPILILDEPSSGLDLESERLVLDGLNRLLVGKTTFMIAHRLSTIRDVTMILVLDRGRIVEHGSHDELHAKGGLYAELLSEGSV
jgi:ABC-type multidrug transport system fused ATPase/permease subunit